MDNPSIVWFRQNLRLDDNAPLVEALKKDPAAIAVFIFDERVFLGKTKWFGFSKTGKFRAQFCLEAVTDLRKSLEKIGSTLVVRVGLPEKILPELAEKIGATIVFAEAENCSEELLVERGVARKLAEKGQKLRLFEQKTLLRTADLPFSIERLPDVFTFFRKDVERKLNIAEPLDSPKKMAALPAEIEKGKLPTLEDLGHEPFEKDPRSTIDFSGGETAALARLDHYLFQTRAASTYKLTRNGLIGADYSTKFSPFLAQGSVSPRRIFSELKKYESKHGANDSTYWIFFELLWRDFFHFQAQKHGDSIFLKNGPKRGKTLAWRDDYGKFRQWAGGKTEKPFVNSNMNELAATGWMSNRGRQNVASFLAKDLLVNWQMGAEWFESLLVDYDAAANWGNWNYVAGVGADPREDRYFNIEKQAKTYDPTGEFVRLWAK